MPVSVSVLSCSFSSLTALYSCPAYEEWQQPVYCTHLGFCLDDGKAAVGAAIGVSDSKLWVRAVLSVFLS